MRCLLAPLAIGIGVLGSLVANPAPVEARISRIEIARVESPTFEGTSFGDVGPYEKLVGTAHGEIDPEDRRNEVIVDLQLAPRNIRGLVEYSTDVLILRPVDAKKGNRRLLFDINNRGDARAFGIFNNVGRLLNDPTSAADAGIGFLMRQGYTVVLSGWDGTVGAGNGRLTIKVPTIRDPGGAPLTGVALEEFVIDNSTTQTGRLTYPAATLDKGRARLTQRVRYEDPPVRLPATGWEYVDASRIRLLPAGTAFSAGRLYEFVYPATDPKVLGIGLAAIRDVASFLHHGTPDEERKGNPLADSIDHVYSFCFSQPCRAMHDFVRLGFNEDETGRRAIDGVLNWVGGGSGIFLNYRFGQPAVTHRQHIGRWFPEFEFPFANQVTFDPITNRTDGRLKRCLETNTCPKIFEVNSENEYWAKAMSVAHLDVSGRDLGDAPDVRSYLLAGLPHAPASGPGICQQPRNPLAPNPILRALLVALDEWVADGTEPPASRLPRRDNGTLVASLPQSTAGFPNIPGVTYNGRMHTGDWLYFGDTAEDGIVKLLPPVLRGSPYPALVPKTDADGNGLAGIRLPDISVPLATYTGWALRAAPPGANEGCDAAGQKIDFRQTAAERLAAGDPRLSIEERYPTHSGYVNLVTAAANRLREDRLMLAEDVDRFVAAAEARPIGARAPAAPGQP
jgi:hypothetical protein